MVLSLLVSLRFQVLFHSPPGVLFTFPSRYSSLSVTWSYLAFWDGPHFFRQDFSCPAVLRIPLRSLFVSITGVSPSLPYLSRYLIYEFTILLARSLPQQNYFVGLGCSDFARHYSRNRFCFLFLRVLRCFSSPGSPCITIYSLCNNTILLVLSSLIRISVGHRIFAPLRSFSQLVTSFFGAMYQGILRKPFVAWSSLFLLVFSQKKFYSLYTRLIRFQQLLSLKIAFNVLCLLTKLALLSLWKFSLPFRTRLYFLLTKKK